MKFLKIFCMQPTLLLLATFYFNNKFSALYASDMLSKKQLENSLLKINEDKKKFVQKKVTNPVYNFAEDKDLVKGVWLVGDKRARIMFFETPTGYIDGRIVWLRDPIDPITKAPKRDKYNPDTSKQNELLIGLVTFKNFKYEGRGYWKGGIGYDPSSGKTYNGIIYMNILEGNINNISLTGYIGISLLGRKSKWTRIKDTL